MIEQRPAPPAEPAATTDRAARSRRPATGRRKQRREHWWRGVPWRQGLVVAALYILATVVMTWPSVPRIADSIPDRRDSYLQIWILRWVQHALATEPWRLYEANTFYPLEYTLAYTDSNVPVAIFTVPLQLLFNNAILSYNGMVLATFVIAGGGMYALVRQIVGYRGIAFLAGLAFAFLPYRFAHLWNLNQLGHAWTPWVMLAFVLLLRRRTWPGAIALGLLIAVEILSSFYLTFQLGLALAVAVLVATIAVPAARTWRFWGLLLAAAAIVVAIVVPLAIPYFWVQEAQGLERNFEETLDWRASPQSYLKVTGANHAWSWLVPTYTGEDTLFVGGIASLGALIGLATWRRRRAMTSALVLIILGAAILSFGPVMDVGSGRTIDLPYRFLFDHFPLFKSMRATARFGVLANFATIVLASLGAAQAWDWLAARWRARAAAGQGVARRAAIVLTALLAAVMMFELASVPIPLATIDDSAEVVAPYEWLAAQPGREAVMEFPAVPAQPRITGLRMVHSIISWRPLVQGYSGFRPEPHWQYLNAFLGSLPQPAGLRSPVISFVSPANVGYLQDIGVRYILFQRAGYEPSYWPEVLRQAEQAVGAPPAFENATAAIFAVPDGVSGVPTTRLSAPAEASAGWSPTVEVTNPLPRWAVNYVKAPVALTVTWYDAGGKIARREKVIMPVVVVGPPGATHCTLTGCDVGGTPDEMPTLSLPPAGAYTVDLQLTGGLSASTRQQVTVKAP